MRTIEDVLQRLRAEYLEMPGLRLKTDQVQRLCGIERNMCQMVLETLVDARFLCVTPDGHYTRVTEEPRRVRPAKADLRTDARSQKAS
jgi:endonuclease III